MAAMRLMFDVQEDNLEPSERTITPLSDTSCQGRPKLVLRRTIGCAFSRHLIASAKDNPVQQADAFTIIESSQSAINK